MKKATFKDIERINDSVTYKNVMDHIETLIAAATKKGYLKNPGAPNEYTKEISRLGKLCADYESSYMNLAPLKVKSPLILSIEKKMQLKALNQRQAAELLEVKENTFSQILSGKRNVSMKVAKKLYQVLKIDPKTIIEFS